MKNFYDIQIAELNHVLKNVTMDVGGNDGLDRGIPRPSPVKLDFFNKIKELEQSLKVKYQLEKMGSGNWWKWLLGVGIFIIFIIKFSCFGLVVYVKWTKSRYGRGMGNRGRQPKPDVSLEFLALPVRPAVEPEEAPDSESAPNVGDVIMH